MIERVFLPWEEPALASAARHLAKRQAADGALALDGVLVALPGARAARRLTELLIEVAEERGLLLTPPEITTIGALPERLYDPARPLADDTLARRCWARALRELSPSQRDALFPHPPERNDLHGWHRLAGLIHRLHRRTAAEGLDFSDVAAACRDAAGYDDSGRWEALARAQEAYHRALEGAGRMDRDAARLRAVEEDVPGRELHVYLVGIPEMPGLTRALLEAQARRKGGRVTALVHAPRDREAHFDALGCVRAEAWAEARVPIPETAIEVCGRPPAQADAVVRRLAGEGRPLAPDEVTVGVPDGEVVPHLEQRLSAYGVPHRHAAGTPVGRTGPFRLLEVVAEYLEGRRYRDFAALLRHPAAERTLDLPDAVERADRYFEEHLPATVSGSPLESTRHGGRFRAVVEGVEEELGLGRLRGRRPSGAWMPAVLRLLERVYGREALDRRRPEDRQLMETLELLRDGAAALHRLPDAGDEACDGATAIRLLLSEVRDQAVPPPPGRTAVELLGWLELHLDDAPVLVLTGVDDGSVPGSVSADLFLPNGLRSRLGLPDDAARYARDVYLLSAILASREEVHIVVGRRDVDGNPLRPSRLLLTGEGRELARRVKRLFSETPPAATALPRLGVEPAAESRFQLPPEPVIRLREAPAELSVTDFRVLLRAPYRWVLERHLGLEAHDDRDRELDGAAFGRLAHRILHRFAQRPEARTAEADAVRACLEELLDEVTRQRYGREVVPAVRLQAEQLRGRLREFAGWQAGRAREGWELVAAEVGAGEGGVAFDVDGEPVRLRGRIDRIERHRETGAWAVLDYKTSDVPRSPDATHRAGRGDGRRWVDLQLPLYRHLARGIAVADDDLAGLAHPDGPVILGYVNISREGVALAPAEWSGDELAAADEAARRAVRLLRAGAIPFDESSPGARREDPLAALLGQGQLVVAERRRPGRPDAGGAA